MEKLFALVFGLFVIVMLIITPFRAWGTYDTASQVTVTEKTVKRSKDKDKYLIFTTDSEGQIEVFQNTDAWLNGKFDSSNVWAQISVGDTCTFQVNSWRVPIFSWYRNILEVTDCQ